MAGRVTDRYQLRAKKLATRERAHGGGGGGNTAGDESKEVTTDCIQNDPTLCGTEKDVHVMG